LPDPINEPHVWLRYVAQQAHTIGKYEELALETAEKSTPFQSIEVPGLQMIRPRFPQVSRPTRDCRPAS
jgi:hypothetical protein